MALQFYIFDLTLECFFLWILSSVDLLIPNYDKIVISK